MIGTLITAAISYWLGKQEEERKILANSPGTRAAGGLATAPTNAKRPDPNQDVNALPTGDVHTTSGTP